MNSCSKRVYDMSNISSVSTDASNDENESNAEFINLVTSVEALLYNLESTNDVRDSQSNITRRATGDIDCSVASNRDEQLGISNHYIQSTDHIQNQFLRLSGQQGLDYGIRDIRSHSSNNGFVFLPSRAANLQSLDGFRNRARSESYTINMSTQISAFDSVRTSIADYRDTSEISAPMIPQSSNETLSSTTRLYGSSIINANAISSHKDQPISSSSDRLNKTRAQSCGDSMDGVTTTSQQSSSCAFAKASPNPESTITRKKSNNSSINSFIIKSSFPQILYKLLDNAEQGWYHQYVSWQSHGRAFRVHDPLKFTSDVMPLFFHQTRFPSFQRQLALYGFIRMKRKGNDYGAYYHEQFIRGNSQICCSIQRTAVKGSWVNKDQPSREEPDFYKLLSSHK